MDEVDALRREVERLRRAATRKVSRIKTHHGVAVTHTEFDPRRAPHLHERYTAAQLRTYKEKLESFLSRSQQFVPDASRRPISRSEWQAYKERETRYRNMAANVYDRLKNVELPYGGTIEARMYKMTPSVQDFMHNPVTNLIFDPHTREPGDIVSRKALRKLTRDLDRRNQPSVIKRRIREAQEQFTKMVEVLGEPDLQRLVGGLTQNQFVALWNYTSFAAAVALSYAVAQKFLSPKEESWGHEMVRQQMSQAYELIDWAKKLPL